MSPPRVAIVGSGRSGSGYIAEVLQAAGVRCGHEAWWNPSGTTEGGLAADSSWCALALGLRDFAGHVLHQVRHPLDVVSSIVKTPPFEPYTALMSSLVERRLLFVPSNIVEYAMAIWVAYYREAQQIAELTWRVEDVDAALVRNIASLAGAEIPLEAAAAAIAMVPRDFNFHGAGRRLAWQELPEGALRDALTLDAAQLEYS